ncbi:MAG: hypothetical protein O3A92_16635 [Verrucomicrobia bacterium]|nr:hypothetical protein [Verrucomicrobiota bacterium]
MLSLNFLYAAALLSIGIAALNLGVPLQEAPLGYTGIFFGGAALICALFAIKNRRHGLMGAAFLSFLALLTAGSRFFSMIQARQFNFADPQTKLLCAFLAISALYLSATIIKWRNRPHP